MIRSTNCPSSAPRKAQNLRLFVDRHKSGRAERLPELLDFGRLSGFPFTFAAVRKLARTAQGQPLNQKCRGMSSNSITFSSIAD